MTANNNDTAAFPYDHRLTSAKGLTKLEYAAIVAMQGLLANPTCEMSMGGVAEYAIAQAQELLTQLDEVQNND